MLFFGEEREIQRYEIQDIEAEAAVRFLRILYLTAIPQCNDSADFQIWVYRTVCLCLACVICPLTAARSSPRGGALKQRKNACRNKGFRWVESERLPLWGSSRRRRVRGQFPRVSTNQQPYKPQFKFLPFYSIRFPHTLPMKTIQRRQGI